MLVKTRERGCLLYWGTGVCMYAELQGDGCVVGGKVAESQVVR